MRHEVVDIPTLEQNLWGRFSSVLDEVELLPPKKCVKIDEKLTTTGLDSLRNSARVRGYRLSIRTTPDATYVWKKEAKQ